MIRLILTIILSLILFFSAFYILKAETIAPVPPVLIADDGDILTLHYRLPYARRIAVTYSYADGAIMNRTFLEPVQHRGVTANLTIFNAASLRNVQIVVTLQDNSIHTFEPRVVGENALFIPLVDANGGPNNAFTLPHDGTLTFLADGQMRVQVRLGAYDVIHVSVKSTAGTVFELFSGNDVDSTFPYDGEYVQAFGYVVNVNNLAYETIKFEEIHVEE